MDDHWSYLDGDELTCLRVHLQRCNRCGTCVEMCPMDVLRLDSQGLPAMRYPDDCWFCQICEIHCPRRALVLAEIPYLIS
jgi:NAD-dependent dihydropyrimidine dehydrogenase PreA subunit